jgi:hypothetical protein
MSEDPIILAKGTTMLPVYMALLSGMSQNEKTYRNSRPSAAEACKCSSLGGLRWFFRIATNSSSESDNPFFNPQTSPCLSSCHLVYLYQNILIQNILMK